MHKKMDPIKAYRNEDTNKQNHVIKVDIHGSVCSVVPQKPPEIYAYYYMVG